MNVNLDLLERLYDAIDEAIEIIDMMDEDTWDATPQPGYKIYTELKSYRSKLEKICNYFNDMEE